MVDFVKQAIEAAKKHGPNMTEASKGGGYEKPAEGFVRLRFVGYFETGKRERTYKGEKKINDTAELVFELSGPKHMPRDGENGTKYPQRLTERVNLSFHEKSNFFKMFTAMNWESKATHITELLGQAFVGKIEHNKKTYDGKEVTFANLRDVRKPFAVNPETGEDYRLEVAEPLTDIKLFLWDFASPEMWDALYIEGEYEARTNDKGEETSPARSKNVIQEKIMAALNWKGNTIYDYAMGKVTAKDSAELDEAMGSVEEVKSEPEGDEDPMAGIA